MKRCFFVIPLVLILAACEPPGFYENEGIYHPTLLPEAKTEEAAQKDLPQNVVEVRWSINAPVVQNCLEAGSTAEVTLRFTPSIIQNFYNADGSLSYTTSGEWNDHPVSRMRYCLELDEPCTEPGEERSFETQVSTSLPLDWLGLRQVYLMVEFLDRDGNPVPATDGSNLKTITGGQLVMKQTITTAVNPTTPLDMLPAVLQTAVAEKRAAYPVNGSIKIEGSPCCAGGTAGSKLEIKVNLQAESPAGRVTEMRLGRSCPFSPADLRDMWEPFTGEKTLETTIPINWTTFSVNVQYRDEKGNLSQVYCDSLGLEGSPQEPSPTP
ncbi:MAG: hypothetical protein GYA15_05430 [Leptolinea sp.]|nr:hypothetical protein [Leptolinea sp.]